MNTNLYINTAMFYDKENDFEHDIGFYKSFINNSTDVLEIGCGTGRITLSLAQICNSITGIDLSDSMLDIFEKKFKCLDISIRNKIKFLKRDMIDFNLDQKFDVIILPNIVFQALIKDETRIKCLQCVSKHMKHDSIIIIDMFHPDIDTLRDTVSSDYKYEYFDDELNCVVKKQSVRNRHDASNQTISFKYIIDLIQEGNVIKHMEDDFMLGYMHDRDARKLFEISNLNIIKSYGWYDFSEIKETNKRMLIYILNKSKNI